MNMINIVVAVLIMLIVLNVSVPNDILDVLNSTEVKIIVIVVGVVMSCVNPLIGIVGLVSYFVLIFNSKNVERKVSFGEGPSEKFKKKHMNIMNDSFPVTLEEEIIKGSESNKAFEEMPESEYKPLLEKTCNQSLNL